MNRKAWFALAALIVVVLGGWLTASFVPGSAGRTPVLPAMTTSADPATTAAPRTTSLPWSTSTRGRPTAAPIDPESRLPWISTSELPPEAHDVLRRINAGGPFEYAKDGTTFGNFEGLLPAEPRGYYKEYTVDTPGSRDRGARRIVTGDRDRIRYWTDDHYESFARIRR